MLGWNPVFIQHGGKMGHETIQQGQQEPTPDNTKAANQSSVGEILKGYLPESVTGLVGYGGKDNTIMAEGDSLLGKLTGQVLSKYLIDYGLSSLLAFADRQALDMLKSYETFSQVYDKLQRFTNGLSLAISVWGSLPAPVRTGVLFLTGRVMYYLPKGMFDTMEGYLVDADKEIKNTALVSAVEKLTLVVQLMGSPVSSAIGMGKYLYSYFMGPSVGNEHPEEQVSDNGLPESGEHIADSLAKIDLHIIWLEIKGLKLAETTNGEDQRSKEGGLYANFALGARMFATERSLGEKQRLTLIFPWSGGAILESDGPISVLDHFMFGNLFEVDQLEITYLKATNQGIDEARFALAKLSVFHDTITTSELEATYVRNKGMAFAGNVALSLLGWKASSHIDLMLDAEGGFVSGKINSFEESTGVLTVKEASMDREKGFHLQQAEVDLEKLVGLNMSAFVDELAISNQSVKGKGGVRANGDIGLFKGSKGDHLKITNFMGSVAFDNQAVDLNVSAGLVVQFDNVEAGGDFTVGYHTKDGQATFKLDNGYFSANYPGFTATAKEISYNHEARQFLMPYATASISSLGIEGEIHNLLIDGTGVQFTEIKVKGPDEVKVMDGLTLKGLGLQIEKASSGYVLRANAGVDLKLLTPQISGRVDNMELELSNDSFQANVDYLGLEASWFKLSITDTAISKVGFSAAEAELLLKGGKAEEGDKGLPGLNTGLLDFLPVNEVGVKLSGIDFSAMGLTIERFTPMIPPIHFKALGIAGSIDFERMHAALSGSKSFSLADMLPGLPLSFTMIFPVLPGLEVYGSLGASANFTLMLGMEAQNNDGLWDVSGGVGFDGDVGLRVELGAQLGSQAIVALSAGAFAEGGARLQANAEVGGGARYDRDNKRFKRETPLVVKYNLAADAVAKVGVVIKAKAFYVFEKKLYEWTAAEWVLGTYRVKGQLGEQENGDIAHQSASTNRSGLDSERAKPVPYREIRGKELEDVLRSDEYVSGSGELRKKLLADEYDIKKKWVSDLLLKQDEATKKFEKARVKHEVLMDKKNTYLMKLLGDDDNNLNEKLEEFNNKHRLEEIWECIETEGHALDRIESSMKHALNTLEKIISLETSVAEFGLGSALKEMEDIETIAVPDMQGLETLISDAEASLQDYANDVTETTPILTVKQFIVLSTTKRLGLWSRERKSIGNIDRALEAYHQTPGPETLHVLSEKIDAYGNRKNERMPAVLLLKKSVEELKQQLNK